MRALSFVVCRCFRHATFMNPQGASGPDVCSKREARSVIDTAIMHESVPAADVQRLIAEVQGSPLPEHPDEAPEEVRAHVHEWTLMRRTTNGHLPFGHFHDYFPLV